MIQVSKDTLANLLDAAKQAAANAYAPYSRFAVGAAVLTADGSIHSGCNVENAAYPLGICAERNAIGHMVASVGKQEVVAVVVYTPTPTPASPCGGCRQVINEFGPEAAIYSFCDTDTVLETSLPELLPNAFGPSNLHR